jgi:putative ABC transport system permease protein
MSGFFQDARYTWRQLTKSPAFTFAVILSLALGIGANTAIFSVINAVMLRSLPVQDPHQLVVIKPNQGDDDTVTNPIWEEVRANQKAFSGVLAYSEHPVSDRFDLSSGGESHFAQGMWVSGDFFHVLGVPAIQGRVLTTEDDQHGGGKFGPVAVISYSFWKRNFPDDPNVIGKTISLNRHQFEIVGVTPSWFSGLEVDHAFDVAIPIGCAPILFPNDRRTLDSREWWWLRMVGRLAPGVTLQQADAQMKAIAPEIYRDTVASNWPKEAQQEFLRNSFNSRPIATGFADTATQYRTALFTLMGIAGLVLLIACVNIANLLLARAMARRREFSVRIAIGASRWRVIRQLMTESIFLSVAGAAGGIVFAMWGSKLLVHLLSTRNQPLEINLSLDPNLLLFTILVSILTALLFGLAPALSGTRIEPTQMLKDNAAGPLTSHRRLNWSKILVGGQVALSLTLLVGAALFISTMRNLLTTDIGFNRHNVLTITANVQQAAIPRARRVQAYQEILDRIRALPNVVSASSSFTIPISGMGWNGFTFPEGFTPKSKWDTLALFNRVSPDYFKTMQTSLIAGRDFNEQDNASAPKVMIIGESAARSFFGSQNPIGKTISLNKRGSPGEKESYEVIGVVKDTKYFSVGEEPGKTIYLASGQDIDAGTDIRYEVRFSGPMEAVLPSIRETIAAQNRDTSLEFRSLDGLVNESLAQPRVVALLSLGFGLLALLLAAIGLYGITAYAVTKRRAEIGIRMALGAPQKKMIWLMLRDVLLLLVIGMSVGLGIALAMGRFIKSLLYGVHANNPTQLAMAAMILVAATMIAAYIPARRAAKVDPMVALRYE